MNRLTIRRSILLIIIAAFLISLCSCVDQALPENPDVTPDISPSSDISSASSADQLFTARYDSDFTFNPITGTSPDNMALVPLMYEGLFVLNEELTAEPVLCASFDTSDGINYTFKLKPNIAMSDGSTLNATDVKYSLTSAMQKGRFVGRFKIIDAITAADSLTLKITLKSANYKLPELLDVPIIKSGSINANYPPGSGPYYLDRTGAPRLLSMAAYRDAASMPVPVIYLKACSDTELSVAFSSQAIDLFWDDPADSSDISILSDHEIRYYNTTILQYVGFNVRNSLLSNANLRRALGLIIDRKDIVSNIYSSHALAAPLILSPAYSQYDPAWENSDSDPLASLSQIFASLQMADDDSDGYLEINKTPFTLTFIVNADNKYKVAAAQMITDSLKTVGINVDLKKLHWDAYMTALTSGSFDMYYGDISLSADYDLTELLSPGGSLDYGHAASSGYQARIDDFLASADDAKEKTAAQSLCAYVSENAPIIPVLYRQYTVHTNKNVVSGMKPTPSSLFYGLTGWKITLG